MPSTRRFLTVLVLELKYSGVAVQRLSPDEIQTGFELFWNSFYRFVADEEGLPLPPQSQEFIALFGAETPYADHAVRASKSAAAISIWLREWAFKFSQTGREIPHFSIALHCGETVAMQIPGSETLPWAVVGEAVSFARTLIRVCRPDEVICSEAFLTAFLENLPPGQESLDIATEEEPDLAGLNWDVADFLPLEEHLRNKTVLVGAHVRNQPETASLWFTYLYAFSDPDSNSSARVAAIFFSGTIPEMELSGSLADKETQFRRLGKYRLLRTLGHGGMGTVWLGQDGFGNYAAIKTLLDPASGEPTQVTRFEREAQVMTQLNHRNICRIIEMGEYDGTRFIAMEYVTGVTLGDILENVPGRLQTTKGSSGKKDAKNEDLPTIVREVQEKKLADTLRKKRRSSDPPSPVLRLGHTLALFMKICEAVQFAHGKGILHRDLKPGNVLIREDGDPVVADFGLAKLRQANDAFDVSHTGQVLGTLAYMSPEQSQSSKEVDERADIFSLGAILYRMLTGAEQFRTSGNFATDVQKLQAHEPIPPSKVLDTIPDDLDAIVLKSLSKEPSARYRSTQALRDDIARFLGGEPIHARPPSTADMARKLYQRHRVMINSIGGAVFFGLILVIFAFWSITGQRNAAVVARNQAEREKRSANISKRQTEEALKSLKEEQSKNVSLRTENTTLKSSHDIHAVEPLVPYASTLVPVGSSAESVARASMEDARNRLRRLSDNPKLRHAMVTRSGDDQWKPFPSEILDDLGAASESAATARILAPSSAEAWILSGWCALLDFDPDSARRMFDKALDLARDQTTKARCEKLLESCNPTGESEAGALANEIVPKLKATGDADDTQRARILSSLHAAVQDGSELTIRQYRDILALSPGARMIAASFLEGNQQGVLDVDIVDDAGDNPRLYVNGRDVVSLKPLEEILGRLVIAHPGKAWIVNASHTSATGIPLLAARSIVASNSQIQSIRVSSTCPVREIDVSSSPFSDLTDLLKSASLEICRLNNCPLTDPRKLFDPDENRAARSLRALEIAGVNLQSFDGITRLASLERLKFSPELVGDRASIQALRTMPSLRQISTEGEPDNQTADEFWHRHPELQ